MEYIIQLNEKGSRSLLVTSQHLATIKKFRLFDGLVDSSGYITEETLDKLKFRIRSMIASSTDDSKDLLDLCIDVIYHNYMKSFGLSQLIKLSKEQPVEE